MPGVYFLTKCLLIITDAIHCFHSLILANIFIYLYDNQYFQSFILLLKQISFIFILILVMNASIFCCIIRKKEIDKQDLYIKQEENVTVSSSSSEITTNNDQKNNCYHEILLKDLSSDEKLTSKSLICYCDGSYSYTNQIGYSGFRASNGYNKYCPCLPSRPRNGSTEAEVYAACLALRYTAKYHYNRLILYTDNSKVEQLLTRPKEKDRRDYPKLFNALDQCHQINKNFYIKVKFIRGHPTWYEQRHCSIKREFAKVDRQVRQKRQQYEYGYYFISQFSDRSYTNYSYQYRRFTYPKTFGATFIMTSTY